MVASYLPQLVGPDPRTPIEICHAARPDIARVERELEECAVRLGSPEAVADMAVMQRAINRQERLIQEYDQLGGHTFDGTVRGHLQTLGLSDAEMERPHAELSGGKRKLVALAACLAQEPDLLLLDEPETHLDAVRRSGLEELVGEFPGAVVMVSHDRYLLDETVTRHRRARPRRRPHVARQLLRLPGRPRARAAAAAAAVRRTAEGDRAARGGDPALQAVGAAGGRPSAYDAGAKHPAADRAHGHGGAAGARAARIGLSLQSGTRGGKRVAEWRDASVAFGAEPVLIDVDLTMFRGERVGVIGETAAERACS